MTTSNGHILFTNGAGGNPPLGYIPLSDGRYAILANHTRPQDGETYLYGIGADQAMRTYTAQQTPEGFSLTPEAEPASIAPRLVLLLRVVDDLAGI